MKKQKHLASLRPVISSPVCDIDVFIVIAYDLKGPPCMVLPLVISLRLGFRGNFLSVSSS
jgi:hypothetical protein